jgi:hypothetical protein
MRRISLDRQRELLAHLAFREHSCCVLSQAINLNDSITDEHLAVLRNLLGIVATHEAMIVNAFDTETIKLKLIHLNAKCNKTGLFVEHNMEHFTTATR